MQECVRTEQTRRQTAALTVILGPVPFCGCYYHVFILENSLGAECPLQPIKMGNFQPPTRYRFYEIRGCFYQLMMYNNASFSEMGSRTVQVASTR